MMESVSIGKWLTDSRRRSLNEDLNILAGLAKSKTTSSNKRTAETARAFTLQRPRAYVMHMGMELTIVQRSLFQDKLKRVSWVRGAYGSEMHTGQRCIRIREAYGEAEPTSGQPSQRLHDPLKMNVAEYEPVFCNYKNKLVNLKFRLIRVKSKQKKEESPCLTAKASQIQEHDSHSAKSSSSVGLTTAPKIAINSPCLNGKKELAIPEQSATGKESTNPLMADSLPKTIMPTKLVKPQGQDTTGNMVVWTLILLGQHMDWQTRAVEEILHVFGDKRPDTDGLSHLKVASLFISMIFIEVLRLYSPAVLLPRLIHGETKLRNITLPAGALYPTTHIAFTP
ncbi:cytochrome P450 CYP72A219-like protein [Tanacetum coccineum]|uniref:Cytochrome P450 CYP72A219-like protein n=1 Tax=Tanacetum coccineum TaxID=301880 RepID=A0ABQ4Z1A7_9ASTR